LLSLLFSLSNSLLTWKMHWSGEGWGRKVWLDFASSAPVLGAGLGFLVTWIRCRQSSDMIKEPEIREKIKFPVIVFIAMLFFMCSAYSAWRVMPFFVSKLSTLQLTLRLGLVVGHHLIFGVIFYKLFSKALLMYHHTLLKIDSQGQNYGAFSAMLWIGYVAVIAFVFYIGRSLLVCI
jgi:hypothetical protein